MWSNRKFQLPPLCARMPAAQHTQPRLFGSAPSPAACEELRGLRCEQPSFFIIIHSGGQLVYNQEDWDTRVARPEWIVLICSRTDLQLDL